MTALEESRYLGDAVASVFAQDYDGPLELVVAVGPSKDNTEELAQQLAARYGDRMRVHKNPTGRTPAGLNIAIAGTDPTTSIIVRTDGHANLPPDYVRTAVELLTSTGAANVGGMMVPDGHTPFEQAVARGMSERIGLGSASFHVGGEAGPALTVYLGVFRRDVLARLGGFNETFTRAQDWELNYRIRELGELVYFDPRLQVHYRPRPNVRGLSKQFRGSGAWRWQIIRTYPGTASLRYLAAPAAVLGIAASVLAAVAGAASQSVPVLVGSAVLPAGYLLVVTAGAALTRRGLSAKASALYPGVLVAMHMSWGSGFLTAAAKDAWSALRAPARRRSVPATNPRADRIA